METERFLLSFLKATSSTKIEDKQLWSPLNNNLGWTFPCEEAKPAESPVSLNFPLHLCHSQLTKLSGTSWIKISFVTTSQGGMWTLPLSWYGSSELLWISLILSEIWASQPIRHGRKYFIFRELEVALNKEPWLWSFYPKSFEIESNTDRKNTSDNGQMDFLGLCDSASVFEYKIS